MIGFFIAMLSGALMSVQGVFNTKLTESTSLWVANAFVQFTAFLLCIATWLVKQSDLQNKTTKKQ